MALALLVPPAAEAVTLDEVKQHLRIDTLDDDVYLEDLIVSCTAHLEQIAGIRLITQTWRQYLDCQSPNGEFRLETAPVRSVAGMRVFDADGTANELALEFLELDSVSNPPRLAVKQLLAPGKSYNGIEIDLVAGFGDTPIDVPDTLRRALLLLIAHAYEFRGAVRVDQQPASEPQGFRTLIAPFRRIRL